MHSYYIPQNEILSPGLSFTDENGTLFKWNGELFRGIPSEKATFCRFLFDKGIMKDLIDKKLFVDTEITTLKLDYYDIVLKHRTIPFVSYPQEWCDIMLKDAALHQLDFCLELNKHDLHSADASPLNILFDGCEPVFVDFGSIDPIPVHFPYRIWSRYEQFNSVFIRPLLLMAQGKGRIARWLLHDYEQGVSESDFEALSQHSCSTLNLIRNKSKQLKSSIRWLIPTGIYNILYKVRMMPKNKRLKKLDLQQSRQIFFEKIRQEVAEIELPPVQTPDPQGGYQWLSPSIPWDAIQTERNQLLTSLFEEFQPDSLLDIGNEIYRNAGFISALNSRCKIVAAYPEVDMVKKVYIDAKRNNFPILPLNINFFSPSYDLSNYWFTSANQRLQCDVVLAFDTIERLVFEDNIRLGLIVEKLSILSKRWLLVEFVPLEVWENIKMNSAQFSWYNLENYIDEFKKQFRSVKIIPSKFTSRMFLLCEK